MTVYYRDLPSGIARRSHVHRARASDLADDVASLVAAFSSVGGGRQPQ
jgi:hypothetical protein